VVIKKRVVLNIENLRLKGVQALGTPYLNGMGTEWFRTPKIPLQSVTFWL